MKKKQLCWVFGAIAATSFFMLCTGIYDAAVPLAISLGIIACLILPNRTEKSIHQSDIKQEMLTDLFAEFLVQEIKAEHGDDNAEIRAIKLANNIIDTMNQYINEHE